MRERGKRHIAGGALTCHQHVLMALSSTLPSSTSGWLSVGGELSIKSYSQRSRLTPHGQFTTTYERDLHSFHGGNQLRTRGGHRETTALFLVYKQFSSPDDSTHYPHTDLSSYDYLRNKSQLCDTALAVWSVDIDK